MKTARCPRCRRLRVVVIDSSKKKRPPRIRRHADPSAPTDGEVLVELTCPGSGATVRNLDLQDLPEPRRGR